MLLFCLCLHQGTNSYYTINLFLFRQLSKACNIIIMKTNQSNVILYMVSALGRSGEQQVWNAKSICINSGSFRQALTTHQAKPLQEILKNKTRNSVLVFFSMIDYTYFQFQWSLFLLQPGLAFWKLHQENRLKGLIVNNVHVLKEVWLGLALNKLVGRKFSKNDLSTYHYM